MIFFKHKKSERLNQLEHLKRSIFGLDSRIKVLHIIDQHKTGGPGKTIINTAKYINHDNFVIHVGTFNSENSSNTEFICKLKEERIPHLVLADKRGVCLSNLRRLMAYIPKEGIRIIHTHGYKTDIHGVLLKFLLRNICLITTHHGWITNTLYQKCIARLDLFATVFFDGVTVVAESLVHKVPWITRKIRKCMVIHNGIVLTDYVSNNHRQTIREKLSINDNEILFGVFGRLSPEKGCLEMLDAFRCLQHEVEQVKLMYVGEGPLEETIRRSIHHLNLEKKIIMAGYYREVRPLYEAIDVLVCPSKTEGLSNVILEAFAYCRPVVATSVGGNPEIITDNVSGLLVGFGDIVGLKNNLLRLVMQPELRRSLGQAGYKTVSGRFNFPDRVKREEQFYENVALVKGCK